MEKEISKGIISILFGAMSFWVEFHPNISDDARMICRMVLFSAFFINMALNSILGNL